MRRIFAALLLLLTACGVSDGDDGKGEGGPDAAAVVPGGPDAGDQAPACSGGTAYMESCAASDECDTCLCFTYNMGDKRCTQECVSDDDCAAPSTGCSGMGVCKRPNG